MMLETQHIADSLLPHSNPCLQQWQDRCFVSPVDNPIGQKGLYSRW